MSARYFLSRLSPEETSDGIGTYWRARQTYTVFVDPGKTYPQLIDERPRRRRVFFHVNLNLLAAAVGDDPSAALGSTGSLVTREEYEVSRDLSVQVQPWVKEVVHNHGLQRHQLPIGPRLAAFLDDPLGIGRPLGLALPVLNQDTTVSKTWMREQNTDQDPVDTIHGSCDFSDAAEFGQARELVDVCAAADGVVVLFLAGNRGVILEHEVEPGAVFRTLYQHLNAESVEVLIGQEVHAGQRLGRIHRHFENGNGPEDSHLHFGLAVLGPTFRIGGREIPRLWYLIDPFGVYDYHEPDRGPDYVYVPRPRGGLFSPIHGAERAIHWAGDPPIEAFRGELRTPYTRVRRVQARVRQQSAPGDALSGERDQFLVWLDGIDSFFFVALGGSLNRPIERELIAVLRLGHTTGRKVSLEYRFVDGQRHVCAAWLQR